MNRQHGYSLVEIMIAVVISSILMYGVITIMVSSKRTYALQDELAKLQDNARFIMEDITFALRMAGYRGCSQGVGEDSTDPLNGGLLPITGYNNEPITNADGEPIDGLPESDRLTVRYLNSPFAWNPAYVNNYSPGFLKGNMPICLSPDAMLPAVGDNVIVSDCKYRKRYSVSQVSPRNSQCPDSGPSITVNLGDKIYERPIDVFPMRTTSTTYEIGTYNGGVGGINFALYKREGDSSRQDPFVEGIENMQIRYGVATTGQDEIIYQDAPPLATAAVTILSIRVTLLMRTVNKRFDIDDAMDKEFPLDPKIKYNPSEHPGMERGYRHRLFSSVISVRNANIQNL